ncbi:hypothetical protein PFTANZ_00327 [Plasmodium falciparum Tanzania (2000708)]|uniref:Uncharacterized protein n=2 Tax=Plasmodium falciparum TaxID=5833 RepID=A0A024WEJ1_PLAFA|nr:hypothetical protein PFTANZ_00327 [Plasmodium falciparum Tanzania (2000708)]ETW45400.1 hypothetical protein PFNF135_00321 [Plasmodium falciparum NF135/5.C10]
MNSTKELHVAKIKMSSHFSIILIYHIYYLKSQCEINYYIIYYIIFIIYYILDYSFTYWGILISIFSYLHNF